MRKKFKGSPGYTAVKRPNAVTGLATRHIRITPIAGVGTPAAGPEVPSISPTAQFYFADDAESRAHEDRLNRAVLEGAAALRTAELDLADFFSACAKKLFAERYGFVHRQPSRVDAPPELFISLTQRYELQAFELREKNSYVSPEAHSEFRNTREAAAQSGWATTAELALLCLDNSGDVRRTAMGTIASRAE